MFLLRLIARFFVFGFYFWKWAFPWLFNKPKRPYYLRRLFEDLGATWIKLGQIIASSPGLFKREYSQEFQACLDRVPSFPFVDVKRTVEHDLGKSLTEAYATFDETPIAAASIAQVHGATLLDGTDVVVKVQRPRVAERVDADLWVMHKAALFGEWIFSELKLANASGVIEDFHKTIHEELDFTNEAKNMDEFNAIMVKHGADKDICAPRIHWSHTTKRLITMERFHGFKADDVKTARELGIDTERVLRVGMRGWNLTMMLHGFFHGDVHAGNLLYLPERKQIGFIDFGIVGRFDHTQRMAVMRYILSFVTQDYDELAKVMIEMGAATGKIDEAVLSADLRKVYQPLLEQKISDIQYGKVLPDIVANARTHGLRAPREFILIMKQLLYFDRYAKLAAPNLNVFNDVYLVDFLFTPAAAESGIDMMQVQKLLMGVQTMMMKQMARQAQSQAQSSPA